MKLDSQIKKWQEAGIINSQAANAILEFEAQQPEKNYVLYGVIAVGITTLVLGLISIIAANWNDITPFTKLTCYFILQTSLGVAYLRISPKNSFLKSGFLWFFTLTFLGGIGLVGQIFHLASVIWKPLAFWLFLALFPTLLEKRKLLMHIWMIIFFITEIFYLGAYQYSPLYLCATALVLTAVGLNGLTRLIGLSENFEVLALNYGTLITLITTSSLGNFLWTEGTSKLLLTYHDKLAVITVLFLSAGFAWLSGCLRKPNLSKGSQSKLILLFCFMLSFLAIPYFINLKGSILEDIIGASGFIILWALAAWIAATENKKRFYNLCTFMVALRFIGVYFEVFGSLMQTGFGLILSGFVILMVAYIWNRYRKNFIQRVHRIS